MTKVKQPITKILVVDDEAAMREVLQMRLQKWGYEVCLAEDGVEGKKMAESHDPDIVISDDPLTPEAATHGQPDPPLIQSE